jgi:AcrR family transcriptional regulator
MTNARARLTETAARLFSEKGFSNVGINEIVRDAEVARMSLYNNFASKEDLALAAYETVSEARHAALGAAIAAAANPRSAILAVFDVAIDIAQQEDFRGCAFLNLAAHLEPGADRLLALVRDHKARLRETFEHLAADDGQADPGQIGRQLLALWDGALADAHIEGGVAPISAAREAAECLLRSSG